MACFRVSSAFLPFLPFMLHSKSLKITDFLFKLGCHAEARDVSGSEFQVSAKVEGIE